MAMKSKSSKSKSGKTKVQAKSKTTAKPQPKKSAPKKPAVKKPAPKKPARPAAKKAIVKKPAPKPVSKPAPPKQAAKPASKAPAKPVAKSQAVSPRKPASAPPHTPAAIVSPAPPPVERPRPKTKILPREFMIEIANVIRAAIASSVHEAKGREIVGTAPSGDATFEIDRVAEKALLTFLKSARIPIAYYSEDSGYTTFTNTQPQNLLIIDPIDGTRAAKSGFESCAISIASTRIIERPVMADLDNACVAEIVGDRVFYAERGKGTRVTQGEHVKRPKLSKNVSLEHLSWTMTVPGRPAELIFPTAARLIDLSSLKGGFFACNSTSYSITRLITNQLDACVDFANRYYRDIPSLVKDHFINAGRGTVIGVAPYDLAASLLIAQEAGCIVTDAYGKSFDDVLLLDTTVENQRSIIAAGNPELHQKLLKFFEMRMSQYEDLLRRRAERVAAREAAGA